MSDKEKPGASAGSKAPSRRDVLRYGREVIPGVVALTSLGSIASSLATEEGEAAPVVIRREITSMVRDDPERFRKLRKAIAEMKKISDKDERDPAGWVANAQEHFRTCTIDEDLPFNRVQTDPRQIHFCWWFLPWHRAFLWVTQRKIQEVAGDRSIGLPYWNWSVDRTIPKPYRDRNSSLFDPQRYGPKRPLTDAEVGYDPDFARRGFGVRALAETRFSAPPGRTSFGGSPRPNPQKKYPLGALEATPHNPVHVYVGGQRQVHGQFLSGDMADFAVAARDPIFFAHHGNIDRLWEIWRQDAKRRATEPTSKAFLDHTFVFQGLDGLPIEVRVGDMLKPAKLGYRYDTLDVFGGRKPPRPTAAPEAARSAALTRTVDLVRGRGRRVLLALADVNVGDRAASLTVFLGNGRDRGAAVGTIAMVLSRGRSFVPLALVDVTEAVSRLPASARTATVTIVAEALSDEDLPPPAVSVGTIELRLEGDE